MIIVIMGKEERDRRLEEEDGMITTVLGLYDVRKGSFHKVKSMKNFLGKKKFGKDGNC